MAISVDELLAGYAPPVREIALRLRALILEEMPAACEQVDVPSRLIAYGVGPKMGDTVCVISPYAAYANLGIYRAVELPDPAGLLEGTGKKHRHVKVCTLAGAESPALRALLQAAIELKGQGSRGKGTTPLDK